MSDENGGRRQLELPDRRKTTYDDLAKRLDAHIANMEARFRRWLIRGLLAFAIIGLASAVGLVGFGLVLSAQNQRTLELCESTNARHDNAINALTIGSNLDQKNAPTEAAKAEIRRRRDVTISLIDAVSPKEADCRNPVKVKVQPTPEATP